MIMRSATYSLRGPPAGGRAESGKMRTVSMNAHTGAGLLAGLRALPAALLGLWNLEISVAEEALVPELASARLLVLARGNGVRVCVLVLALVPKVATLRRAEDLHGIDDETNLHLGAAFAAAAIALAGALGCRPGRRG
eukprot:CAMPEP_0176273384 /NCGR_PEP_ID=MMETSP0121_2-20121125/46193_1 /TAXON_ID=160619 /ORGANISM="Kryptoperidinium foliaceum, Strain CCMP 1326" /LENGTH=137 /DNA_ID=CAMNT_0017613569 /DNA_START=43 /DNA_END=458 /DNA_ORIENTATION=-